MAERDVAIGELVQAAESGRICAVAGEAQREMRKWAAEYGGAFSAEPFDPTLFNTICLCTAFSAPWLTSAELRMANRLGLWSFGIDWVIDYVATSRAEIENIVRCCLAVADGAEPAPDDDLMRFLADIRDELASCTAFPALRHVWREEFQRFLHGMAREWDWKKARANGVTDRPTFEEYLENADNLGFSFVFTSHWIYTLRSGVPTDVDAVVMTSRQTQRIMRLINDLGTYERDLTWGDLNGLMLGVGREEVRRHIAVLADEHARAIGTLREHQPRLARYLDRQMNFCAGFWEVTEFWGAL
ncbi:terpene synthase family protein [Actinomadura sp. HBU206391]|uniref:terpene synthase family protein n=1 Tax=Actinomadura sp. HBU206391 TaxID=2731692 RepID=UPI00164F6CC8|nr:terpene synthase family protein [Actinomadura sp. HBU206391]MBC6458311.1 hypothetical protein [Actinomadura sp. HBU206391]